MRREQPAGLAVVVHFAQGLQHGAPRAVAHRQRDFVVAQLAACRCGRPHVRLSLWGKQVQLRRGAAQGLVLCDASERLPGGVDDLVAAIAAPHHAHGLVHQLEDAREMLLRLAQLFLGALGFVDVLHHAAYARQAPVFDHRLATRTHPDPLAVGAHHLHHDVPVDTVADAFQEFGPHGLAPGRGNVGIDVVARQRRPLGQAVDFVAHVGPVDDSLPWRILPGAQACQAARLLEQSVDGQQLVACALLLGHVVKDKDQAVLAVELQRLGRHQARHQPIATARHQRQTGDMAIALQCLKQALAFVRGCPNAHLRRSPAQPGIARAPEQRAEGSIDVNVASVRLPGNSRGIGQHLVDGRGLGLRCAQDFLVRALLRHVLRHARKAQGAACSVALHHMPA